MDTVAAVLATATTFETLITPAPQVNSAIAAAHRDLRRLFHRQDSDDAVCGDLEGKYPNARAPICSGSTNICTFSAGLQGCCDSSNNCQFYSKCVNHYATEPCSSPGCLRCPESYVYCINYEFSNGQDSGPANAFLGFGCGTLSELDGSTIYGLVGSSVGGVAYTTTVSSPSTNTASTTSTNTGTSSSRTGTGTATGASSTSSSQPNPTPVAKTPIGAIAGGVVGGVLLIAAIIALAMFLRRRRRRHQQGTGGGGYSGGSSGGTVPVLQQNAQDLASYQEHRQNHGRRDYPQMQQTYK